MFTYPFLFGGHFLPLAGGGVEMYDEGYNLLDRIRRLIPRTIYVRA